MLSHQPDPSNVSEIDGSRLPPGFRFHPTEEELVYYYLKRKVANSNVVFQAIGELDFNKSEPWDFRAKAKMGHQGMFYFFSLREKKYGYSLRTNRSTEAGHWKASGKDHVVMAKRGERMLGFRRTLVFYKGPAAKGERTNWIMHEYRLEPRLEPRLDGDYEFKLPDQREWVVCRAFEKSVPRKSNLPESNTYNAEDDAENSSDHTKCSILPATSRTLTPPVSIRRNQIPESTTDTAGGLPLFPV